MNNFHITDHMAWQAQEREQELRLEAQRMNELTRAFSFAPISQEAKPALLTRLTSLLPRFS